MMYDDLPGLGDEGESVTLTRMRARLVRGLALSTLPRPSWLVEDLLPRPSVAFIYGPPKSGKSFIAIDLAASVACGRSWCGKKTTGGTVLYVVGEGISGVVLRQEAWAEYHGETDALLGTRHPGLRHDSDD